MKRYDVTWTITIEEEDIDAPEKAVEKCWKKLRAPINDWIWNVYDQETNTYWEVDCEFQPVKTTNISG